MSQMCQSRCFIGIFAGAWEDEEPDAARLAKETLMEWVADGKI